jgi:uncharacterized protein (DUF4415 family)
METMKKAMKTGIEIPKEILEQAKREYRNASKLPPSDDYPKLTAEQLAEFKPVGMTWEERNNLIAERKAKRNLQTVSVRLAPVYIDLYKSLGKGYTSIMSDVLKYAATHRDILRKAVAL